MVKIVMFKTSLGSENGFDHPKEFLEEKEYDTTESLAEAFVNQGKAVYLSDIEKEEKTGGGASEGDTSGGVVEDAEGKSLDGVPENQVIQPDENKAPGRRRGAR